jgi:epoxyqueuosine reductase
MNPGLAERIRARGLELGFDAVAFSPAGPAPRAEAFRQWIDRGFAGEMRWLGHDVEGRIDVTRRSPWARSIVSAALSYAQARPDAGAGEGLTSLVSRYAVGRDYHEILKEKLALLGGFIRGECGGRAETRSLVDTSAILERDHAGSAGLGWQARNAMTILPGSGSYVFLGEILTDIELPPGEPIEERCGSCTRCLEVCPTGAILEPRLLDARRCISYLTIELRGAIPFEWRERIGGNLFGCDICQEVCPWNTGAPSTREPELLPLDAIRETTLAVAASMNDAAFRQVFKGSAVRRPGRRGFVRNALIVAANLGDGEALRSGRAAVSDSDPVVREAAVWALGRGDAADRREARRAADNEPDPAVRPVMLEGLDRR